MGSQLLFYVGMTLVLGPLAFIITQIIIDYRRAGWKNVLHQRFMHHWNGMPEDELNAWYKVRRTLLDEEANQEKVDYVDWKIANLDPSKFISNTYVTTEGRWVEYRQQKRPYHNA